MELGVAVFDTLLSIGGVPAVEDEVMVIEALCELLETGLVFEAVMLLEVLKMPEVMVLLNGMMSL